MLWWQLPLFLSVALHTQKHWLCFTCLFKKQRQQSPVTIYSTVHTETRSKFAALIICLLATVIVFLMYASTDLIFNSTGNWNKMQSSSESSFPDIASFPKDKVKIGEKDNKSHVSYASVYTLSSADRGLLYAWTEVLSANGHMEGVETSDYTRSCAETPAGLCRTTKSLKTYNVTQSHVRWLKW